MGSALLWATSEQFAADGTRSHSKSRIALLVPLICNSLLESWYVGSNMDLWDLRAYDIVAPCSYNMFNSKGLTPSQLLLVFLFHLAVFKSLFIPSEFSHLSVSLSLYLQILSVRIPDL